MKILILMTLLFVFALFIAQANMDEQFTWDNTAWEEEPALLAKAMLGLTYEVGTTQNYGFFKICLIQQNCSNNEHRLVQIPFSKWYRLL